MLMSVIVASNVYGMRLSLASIRAKFRYLVHGMHSMFQQINCTKYLLLGCKTLLELSSFHSMDSSVIIRFRPYFMYI